MALQFEQVQTKRSEKGEDKFGLCVCIYGNWMAIDYLQDRDCGMDQILVDAMVGLSLLGNAASCSLAVIFGHSNHTKLINSFNNFLISRKYVIFVKWSINFAFYIYIYIYIYMYIVDSNTQQKGTSFATIPHIATNLIAPKLCQ
jgi:hypothetical protein